MDGLEAGAPWDVTFVPFFLNQAHVPEGGPPAWDDPAQQADLLALAAGVVVRDRYQDQFLQQPTDLCLPPGTTKVVTFGIGRLSERHWPERASTPIGGSVRGRGRVAGQGSAG